MSQRKRKPNSVAAESVSLRYFGSRANARLMKVTPDWELRKNYIGRSGRKLSNAPKNLEELEKRYNLLLQYLDTHGVRADDRFFRPASYLPVPSKKQVVYVYVPDDNRSIAQFALQCRRRYGLHAYREKKDAEPPPEILDEVSFNENLRFSCVEDTSISKILTERHAVAS